MHSLINRKFPMAMAFIKKFCSFSCRLQLPGSTTLVSNSFSHWQSLSEIKVDWLRSHLWTKSYVLPYCYQSLLRSVSEQEEEPKSLLIENQISESDDYLWSSLELKLKKNYLMVFFLSILLTLTYYTMSISVQRTRYRLSWTLFNSLTQCMRKFWLTNSGKSLLFAGACLIF